MREHSILYDRDEHGEYLHFYTEMLGSRVFFEAPAEGCRGGRREEHPAPVRAARRPGGGGRAGGGAGGARGEPVGAGEERASRALGAGGERQPVRRVTGPDTGRLRGPR